MLRRFLEIGIYPVAIGIVLIVAGVVGARAQDNAPPEPSVSDAVSTLLAQTMLVALQQAMTPPAPAATPIPLSAVDISTISVVSTTELDLVAGPGGQAARLAPDGEQFVHIDINELCLYEAAAEVRCIDTEAYELRIDPETIRWSPDSRYVTFTEDFFRFLIDPDIWLWDTTTDTLNNLTDDGASRFLFEDFEGNVDLLPTWLPDGTLTFLRYPHDTDADTVLPPEIYTIAIDGSGLAQVGTLDIEDNWAVYSMSAFGNQLMYVYFAPAPDNPNNGVWVSNTDGSNAEHLVAGDEQTQILAAEAMPGSSYILLNDPLRAMRANRKPDASMMRVASIETGKLSLIDPDQFVAAAGWSPDGSLLAYTVIDRENEENSGLYITDTPGNPGQMILAGMFIAPMPRQQLPLVWGTKNTILLSQQDRDFNLVLVELGSETP